MEQAIVEFLAMSGDVGTLVLAYIAFKFDKRVSHLEWWREAQEQGKHE